MYDLSVVRLVSQRVMVLYLGRVMEIAGRSDIYRDARHPYTRSLLNAIPRPDPSQPLARPDDALGRDLPSAVRPPPGCVFHTRCAFATRQCRDQVPQMDRVSEDHQVACHHWRSLRKQQ